MEWEKILFKDFNHFMPNNKYKRISQIKQNIILSPNKQLHLNNIISNFHLNKALIKKSRFREVYMNNPLI